MRTTARRDRPKRFGDLRASPCCRSRKARPFGGTSARRCARQLRDCDGMANPEVSVIVPTFDRLAYLPAAIASVTAQTFGHWELIIVDDGSSDGTASFLDGLRDTRIRPFRLPHFGNPSRARNAGIRLAR